MILEYIAVLFNKGMLESSLFEKWSQIVYHYKNVWLPRIPDRRKSINMGSILCHSLIFATTRKTFKTHIFKLLFVMESPLTGPLFWETMSGDMLVCKMAMIEICGFCNWWLRSVNFKTLYLSMSLDFECVEFFSAFACTQGHVILYPKITFLTVWYSCKLCFFLSNKKSNHFKKYFPCNFCVLSASYHSWFLCVTHTRA